MHHEYLIVGTGMTGAVVARLLTNAGHRVLVVERESAVGGYLKETIHPSGIRIQAHGPSILRTGSERIRDFLGTFGSFEVIGGGPGPLALTPCDGYPALITRMLRGIPVMLHVDYRTAAGALAPSRLTVFTGAIDELFEHRFGALEYEGFHREDCYRGDVAWLQEAVETSSGSGVPSLAARSIEWKHLMPAAARASCVGTVITTASPVCPAAGDEIEHPLRNRENERRHEQYRQLAAAAPQILCCGWRSDFTAPTIEQSVAQAMILTERILVAARLEVTVEALRDVTERLLATDEITDGELSRLASRY